MKILSMLVAVLARAAWGQVTPPTDFLIPDHTGGLYSYYSGQRLQPNQANDIVNAFLDKDLGVVKRTGQAAYGSIAGCTSQVRGGASFKTSGGQDNFFVACDNHVYITSGDGTFTVHGATINTTNRVRFTQTLGKEWITDGVDPLWNTDGVSISSPSQAPAASLIGGYKSRVFVANWSGNKSSVYGSGFANGTDYTIPAVIVDTSPVTFYLNGPNDGRPVTCMFDGYKDVLILFNEDQMFGLYGNGYSTFVLRKLAEVGCTEQESVREYEGKLKWISKYGIYEYNGTNYTRISDPVKDYVSGIIGSDSSVLSLVQTTQADWNQGNVVASGAGAPMSTTLFPGNVVPSQYAITNSTATPSISTTTLYNVGFENFPSTPFTNWTKGGAARQAFLGWSSLNPCTSHDAIFGSYLASMDQDSTNPTIQVLNFSNASAVVVSTTLATYNILQTGVLDLTGQNATSYYQLKVTATAASTGVETLTSSTFSFTTKIPFTWYKGSGSACIGSLLGVDFAEPMYVNNYVTTSTIFDVGFSTPIGTFNAIVSSNTENLVSFTVASSTSSSGVWSNPVAQPLNQRFQCPSREFIRYNEVFSNLTSTKTASVTSVTLTASTTGYFITNCFNAGVISAWDLFQANTVANGGSVTFSISTGPTCGAVTSPTVNWNAQANNATITISTASYLGVRTLFTLDADTQVPILQDITVGFKLGAGRPPLASVIYDNRYWLAFTTNTSSTAGNDTVLVYDYNGKWTKLTGINAATLLLYKRKLYSGSSLGDGAINVQDTGFTDLGRPIYFRFKTPDLDMGTMAHKSLYDLAVEFSPSNDPINVSTVTINYYADKSTTAYSLGTFPNYQSTNGILQDVVAFGAGTDPTMVHTISVEYNSSSTSPLTLYRTMIRYLPQDFW